MRLSEATIGQDFEILAVRIQREVGRRLADMGFTEGARGRVVRGGAFRGPLQVRIRDYDILLRRCEAEGIEVVPVGGGQAEEPAGRSPSFGVPGFRRRGWGSRRHGGTGSRGGLPGSCGDLDGPAPRETGA